MSIRLIDIVKSFKDDLVLDGVNLAVETGETLVLFGPSGAGKTVLLRLLAGVIEPDSGRIEIDERDMDGVEPEDRSIGMAFQNFALFPHMDAFANIASPLKAKREGMGRVKEAVEQVAKLLKIDHVLTHTPRELSNGQKQRTGLARALAGQPSLLLLDDPLRNVDAKLRFEMRLELPRLLKDQRATVVYVTQDYKEAMALGDRIAVVKDQHIRQIGVPEEIYLSPENTEIARLFGDPAINLLEVIPQSGQGGVDVLLSGQSVPVGAAYADTQGQACILGLRPEFLRFVSAKDAGAIPVVVGAETPLNEKTVTLVFTKGGREILVSRPSGRPGPAKGQAYISFDCEQALLFDRTTGNRISPRMLGKKQSPKQKVA